MANGGLKVPVSREAEPSSETRYHGPSVVLTAGKENENTVRCSLTEGVAKGQGTTREVKLGHMCAESSSARMPSGSAIR